jgi:predicted  nucleic acid-binding Zn-ribbon protein
MNAIQRLRTAVTPRKPIDFRRARLMAQLTDIDRRQAQIADRIDHARSDYEAQELISERGLLAQHRQRLQKQLDGLADEGREMSDRDVERREQYERRVAAEVANRRASLDDWVAKLEQSGDHRQAMIWRIEALNIERDVRREFGPPPAPRGG